MRRSMKRLQIATRLRNRFAPAAIDQKLSRRFNHRISEPVGADHSMPYWKSDVSRDAISHA